MRIEWSSYIQTNHEEIDSQHKELFRRMNNYFECAESGKIHKELVATLNYLVEYVKIHFKSEEDIMRATNYPRINEHAKSHKVLTQKLVDIYTTLIQKGASENLHQHLAALCQIWYVSHINDFDKRLAAYIKSYNKSAE